MAKQEITARLNALREAMAKSGIAAAIIPQTDAHQSEYLASRWQVRRWLSGFTGSAGDLVVTADNALLWTDSRYFLQAEEQLDGTGIVLMKDGLPETPSMTDWLTHNLPSGSTIGFDGMLMTHTAVEALKSALSRFDIKVDSNFTPIDEIWADRPGLPANKAFIHDIKYAGESAKEKISRLLEETARNGATDLLVTALDEIAWILNLRGSDVPCNPVVTSYLYLSPEGSTLFIDSVKVDDEVRRHLTEANVKIAPYDSITEHLASIKSARILANPDRTAEKLWLAPGCGMIAGVSPVAMAKACKNPAQIEGTRHAMERDGIALVKAVMEIEQRLADGITTTELDVDEILRRYRSAGELFFDLSFDTIAGYGPHGAIVHYSATDSSSSTLRPEGLLLIDSGAQYLDGTTDITRTIALGTPTAQEKSDFTLVMKGHIALGSAIFPEGTRGAQLDVLARQYLWQHGLTYLHGTGHGVGHFLNVHEGPQSIRLNDVPATLRPGMITSNEPGLYRAGIHGIRCENLVLTVPAFTTEFGRFYKFETLTLFPFDRRLFDLNLMTETEIKWVDQYHTTVYSRLAPMLSATEQQWLRQRTLPLE